MLLDFRINNKTSNWFQSRGNLTIEKLHFHDVRYHTCCIGLLQLFGKIESISLDNQMVYLNKASLIKKYRSVVPRDKDYSDDTIIYLFRLIPHTQSTHHESPLISALDLHKPSNKKPQNRDLHYLDLAEQPKNQKHTLLDAIASSLKEALRQMNGAELHHAIMNQFKMVRLMSADGVWKDPFFADNHTLLIPSQDEAWKRCDQFIDQIIAAIKKNPYLLDTLDHVNASQLQVLKQKIEVDGVATMKYLIPYAFALNGLTSLLAKRMDLFDRVHALFRKEIKIHYSIKYLKAFELIKYYTIGRLSFLTDPIKTSRISKNYCRRYVNLNILEAVSADRYLGNTDNVKAGRTLIQHPVREASVDATQDYPIVQLQPDFPKQWADLYTLWNLTFCSNAGNFPIIATKLLIPRVNDYDSHPNGYLFHRGIALYLHFQFDIFRKLDGEPSYLRGWDYIELTRAMGESAAAGAQKYLAQFNQ